MAQCNKNTVPKCDVGKCSDEVLATVEHIGCDSKLHRRVIECPKVFIKQLFCNHTWILAHKERDYFDYSGYRISVWRCYCAKCRKWKNKKFW